MAVIGASSSLPDTPAKVPSPNLQRALSLGRGNASSCPTAAVRNATENLGLVGWFAGLRDRCGYGGACADSGRSRLTTRP